MPLNMSNPYGNPLFALGTGLLAGNAPSLQPTNPMATALQSLQNSQQQSMQAQKFQMQKEELERKREEAERRRQAFQNLQQQFQPPGQAAVQSGAGLLLSPETQQGRQNWQAPGRGEMAGLLMQSGVPELQEQAISLMTEQPDLPTSYQEYQMAEKDPDYAEHLKSDQATTDYKNALFMGLTPGTSEFNEYMRQASLPSQVTVEGDQAVNPMDEIPSVSDLTKFRNDKGSPPPFPMTFRELRSEGYQLTDKPTEADKRAGYVADSLDTASSMVESILNKPEFDPTSVGTSASAMTNWTASSDYQSYKSAADEWATNMVFLRSGATAREEEKTAAFSNFWPQPGDKPETVRFKTQLRLQQEINALNLATMGGRVSREKAQKKIDKIQKRLEKLEKPQSDDGWSIEIETE